MCVYTQADNVRQLSGISMPKMSGFQFTLKSFSKIVCKRFNVCKQLNSCSSIIDDTLGCIPNPSGRMSL